LTELRLPGCSIGSSGLQALMAALSHSDHAGARSGLRTLELRSNDIRIEGATALADAFRSGLPLHRLDLGYCGMGNAAVAALATGLPHCSILRHLSLSKNCFSEAGATALATGLTGHADLTELDLSFSWMGDTALTALLPALLSCRRLRSLGLAACDLTADSGVALLLLQRSRSLASLRLSNNELGANGVTSLASGLHSGSRLRELHLDSNGIVSRGLTALAQAVTRGWSPTQLDLSGNGEVERGALDLAAALADRARSLPLQSLALAKCTISVGGLLPLALAAVRIPTLRRLVLRGNLNPTVRFDETSAPAAAVAIRDACRVRPDIDLQL